jgi:hypothetical protein
MLLPVQPAITCAVNAPDIGGFRQVIDEESR